MVKTLLIFFLFCSRLLFSQDSLSKIAYPKLNINDKFTISWPLKNFEDRYVYEIYYEKNFISRKTLKKIIEVEPDLNKKMNLVTAYEAMKRYRRNTNISFYIAAPLLILGPSILLSGVAGSRSHEEFIQVASIGASIILVGIISEIISVRINKKYKKSIKTAIVVLNS